jgi:hypothetical protein
VRFWSRCLLIAFISCGMLNLQIQPPLQARVSGSVPRNPESNTPAKPFGIVVRADHARVSEADASNGATVYPGDSVDTSSGGELRVTIGKGQVYLLSSSAANLGQEGDVLRASVLHGTVGFSSLTAQQFELETPEGVIHAAKGLPAFGQVTLTGPKELTVSSYSGTLLLERNDQKLEIEAGQSYDVALVPDPAAQEPVGVKSSYDDKLIWKLIAIGGAALVGYFLWRHFCESPSDPK